jgi:uncharacterized membrane protein YfcA
MQDFLLFLAVGFLAQIVDGALGMAYGVISSTVLLSFGVPPATASATPPRSSPRRRRPGPIRSTRT